MDNANVTPVDVQRYLGGASYPASKEDLIEYARSKGAGEEVIGMMERLPDQDYGSPADVSQAIGEMM